MQRKIEDPRPPWTEVVEVDDNSDALRPKLSSQLKQVTLLSRRMLSAGAS